MTCVLLLLPLAVNSTGLVNINRSSHLFRALSDRSSRWANYDLLQFRWLIEWALTVFIPQEHWNNLRVHIPSLRRLRIWFVNQVHGRCNLNPYIPTLFMLLIFIFSIKLNDVLSTRYRVLCTGFIVTTSTPRSRSSRISCRAIKLIHTPWLQWTEI